MGRRLRFSILLPTRNGGAYLRDVIASALGQSCDDFELVVSDNASDDETRELVAAFASDPRLRYMRLEKPVPVTENWTNALRESRGDYFLMLGDDDAVLPGALDRLNEAIRRNGEPECVTYNGFSFVFPGSVPDGPHGYYADPHFVFGPEFDGEKELSRALRHAYAGRQPSRQAQPQLRGIQAPCQTREPERAYEVRDRAKISVSQGAEEPARRRCHH